MPHVAVPSFGTRTGTATACGPADNGQSSRSRHLIGCIETDNGPGCFILGVRVAFRRDPCQRRSSGECGVIKAMLQCSNAEVASPRWRRNRVFVQCTIFDGGSCTPLRRSADPLFGGMGAQSPTSEDRVILYGSALPRDRRSGAWVSSLMGGTCISTRSRHWACPSGSEPPRFANRADPCWCSAASARASNSLRPLPIPSVVFDIPGVGGSKKALKPYRFSGLAKLASSVLDKRDIRDSVDVPGVSWGGALSQQFAKDYPDWCDKLVLAATSTGAIMSRDVWRRS